MARAFFGGVHPAGWKQLSCDEPIQAFPAPKTVVIPMSQHIGAPCVPLVKVGDCVTAGQKLGDGSGLCVPVHASVSGRVSAIRPCPHPNGTEVLSVVLENDGKYTPCPKKELPADPASQSAEALMACIREAGIVGMGGATFPTHVKLSSGIGKVDTLLLNASECEPYITADDRLLREQPQRVLSGLRILMRVLGLERAVIGIEDNKPEAAAALRPHLGTDLTLHVCRTRYPQGAEKQLIQAVTGRLVPPGALPAAVGCAVFNAATCAAVADAVYEGLPLTKRVVTVTGRGVERPGNYLVPIGTPCEALLQAAGLQQAPYKVLCGGPMMGVAQYDLSVPILKGSNALVVLTDADRTQPQQPHCIRCGRCMDACPMHLMPLLLYRAEQQDDLQTLDKLHVGDCMECGACAYACPAKIPLVQSFRTGKQKLRDAQPKNK